MFLQGGSVWMWDFQDAFSNILGEIGIFDYIGSEIKDWEKVDGKLS